MSSNILSKKINTMKPIEEPGSCRFIFIAQFILLGCKFHEFFPFFVWRTYFDKLWVSSRSTSYGPRGPSMLSWLSWSGLPCEDFTIVRGLSGNVGGSDHKCQPHNHIVNSDSLSTTTITNAA